MSDKTTKILYFSWIRERVGMEEENLVVPDDVGTVSDLLDWLRERNEAFSAALEFPEIVRVALDQEHVEHSHSLGQPREIALFPPMTGG